MQGYFDVVICTYVFGHLRLPYQAADTLRHWLKVDGKLLFVVNFMSGGYPLQLPVSACSACCDINNPGSGIQCCVLPATCKSVRHALLIVSCLAGAPRIQQDHNLDHFRYVRLSACAQQSQHQSLLTCAGYTLHT